MKANVKELRDKGVPVKGFSLANDYYLDDVFSADDVQIIKNCKLVDYIKIEAEYMSRFIYNGHICFADGYETDITINAITDVWNAFLNEGLDMSHFGIKQIPNIPCTDEFWKCTEKNDFLEIVNSEKIKKWYTRLIDSARSECLLETVDGIFYTVKYWNV